MRKTVILLTVLGLSLMLTGAIKFKPSTRDQEIILTVGSNSLTLEELKERLKNAPDYYAAYFNTPDGMKRILSEAEEELLLLTSAKQSGFDQDPSIQKELQSAMNEVLVALYIKHAVRNKISLSDKMLRDYYEQHKIDYLIPERINASHILLKTKEEADLLYKKIKNGADYETVAKTYSIGPTGAKGGSIGWFTAGQMVPEFETAAFAMKKGEVGVPVHTQFGWHIIRLNDRESERQQTFEEVQPTIREAVQKDEEVKRVNALIADLRKTVKVESNPELLEEMQTGN